MLLFEKEKKRKIERDISMNEFFVIPLRRLSIEKVATKLLIFIFVKV
jgi:hypothetical protein